jgi:L-iditol 2-dehydrogenase
MKALLLETVGRITTIDLPTPEPKPDEVVLKVSHCAVCRTDAKMWQQGHRDLVLPRILGHEICAYNQVNGERFVVWPGMACGECVPCRAGMENLCRHMSILGFHRHGGFAELVAVPTSSLIRVPADLPGPLACLAEPLACALNALDQSRLSPGMSVLIFGGGTLGLLIAIAARELGAEPSLVESNRRKIERSRALRLKFGIIGTIECPDAEFDAAVNATPSLSTFSEGLAGLKADGRFCLFSGFSGSSSIPTGLINEIHYRQLQVVGAYGCTRDQMIRALTLLRQHEHTFELLVEDRIGMAQVPAILPAVLSGEAFKYVVVF